MISISIKERRVEIEKSLPLLLNQMITMLKCKLKLSMVANGDKVERESERASLPKPLHLAMYLAIHPKEPFFHPITFFYSFSALKWPFHT